MGLKLKFLWWLVAKTTRQTYIKTFYHVNFVPQENAGIILSSHVNVPIAILLRQISKQKVTIAMTKYDCPSQWAKSLMKRCHINIIDPSSLSLWDQKGILIVHNKRFSEISHYDCPIIPLRACGFDHVKRQKAKNVKQLIHLSFFEPLDPNLSEKERWDLIGNYDVYAWERYVSLLPTLPELWLRQVKARKNNKVIADSTGTELTGHKLLAATLALSHKLEPLMREQARVGICLPPSVGGVMAMMSVLLHGKTMVNLNYTASPEALEASIEEANVRTIITSGKFIEQLKQKGFFLEDIFAQCNIVLLEDIRQQIDKITLFKKMLQIKLLNPGTLVMNHMRKVSIDHTAVVLFSSGSEGKPKGIELTHKNIIGNIKQAMILLEVKSDDSILSILPIFHAFGLTATTLLPIIEGLFMVCHADPTDAHVLAKLARRYRPTVLCGTSTFLRIYARSKQIKPEDFASLRCVVAGAEKLQSEVRAMFEKKFGIEICEGYGATELSPVASANQPNTENKTRNKIGTVGRCLAGTRCMVIDPDTYEELPMNNPGMITIGGVNVMKGYLHDPKKTSQVIFVKDKIRWYQTGDKGKIDEDGYITILDRYSRFAKIGGEMISLSEVEQKINEFLGYSEECEMLAVNVSDKKKGESIALLYDFDMDPSELQSKVNAADINNLMRPQYYLKVEQIPKLGSGKTDFAIAKKTAINLLGKNLES